MSYPIQLTLLGTGTSQGIPVIGCTCPVCTSKDPKDFRFRTAAYIRAGGIGLALDIGPDFRMQMLNNRIQDIHAILLTHEHNDHISGLDDIRPINFLYQRNIPIYAGLQAISELHRRFYYAFDPDYDYPGKPSVHTIAIDQKPFNVGDVKVTPIPVDHGNMQVYGFRVGGLAYVTDAKTISPDSKKLLEGLDVLVINALRFKAHPTHFTIDEVISLCQELKPKRCFLTHLSHQAGLHSVLETQLPEGIYPGYDGLTISIN